MNPVTNITDTLVPAEEVNRRVAEYCQGGFQHQAAPHAIFQDPFIVCPWSDCEYRITAVDFQVEKHSDPDLYKKVIAAWWQGDGGVGCCPACGKHVLYSMGEKKCVDDADMDQHIVLPQDWFKLAYIVN